MSCGALGKHKALTGVNESVIDIDGDGGLTLWFIVRDRPALSCYKNDRAVLINGSAIILTLLRNAARHKVRVLYAAAADKLRETAKTRRDDIFSCC